MGRPQGIDRSADPLISLDENAFPLRVAIMETQHHYYMMTGMLGAPIGEKWSARQCSPQPGDLVYVPDRLGRRGTDDDRLKSFGYYILGRDEPCWTDEEWAEEVRQFGCENNERSQEWIFYIQYGPDPQDVCRWENARCVVVATRAVSDEVWERAA